MLIAFVRLPSPSKLITRSGCTTILRFFLRVTGLAGDGKRTKTTSAASPPALSNQSVGRGSTQSKTERGLAHTGRSETGSGQKGSGGKPRWMGRRLREGTSSVGRRVRAPDHPECLVEGDDPERSRASLWSRSDTQMHDHLTLVVRLVAQHHSGHAAVPAARVSGGAVGPEDAEGHDVGERDLHAVLAVAALHLYHPVVAGEAAAVGGGGAEVDLGRYGHEEAGPLEQQLEVAIVKVVLPQGSRTAVLAHPHRVHEAHALEGQPAAAAAAAVHAAAPPAMVPASNEVELAPAPHTVRSLSVGRPRRFVEKERTEFVAAGGDDAETALGLDQFLGRGCHHDSMWRKT